MGIVFLTNLRGNWDEGNMDLDATFAELLENPEKCAAVDRVFTDIGVPPVSDWVTRWEMQKESQIQESKRIADMATASNDPKNLVRPVLKLSDPKLVLAPGRFLTLFFPALHLPISFLTVYTFISTYQLVGDTFIMNKWF